MRLHGVLRTRQGELVLDICSTMMFEIISSLERLVSTVKEAKSEGASRALMDLLSILQVIACGHYHSLYLSLCLGTDGEVWRAQSF